MDVGRDRGPRLATHAVLLMRGAGELQIGIEPSVVVPEAYAGLVGALSVGAPLERLEQTARTSGLPAAALPDLLEALDRACLLQTSGGASNPAVRVVGAGPLGARVAHELVVAGFPTLYLADLPERGTHRARAGRIRRAAAEPEPVDLLVATLGEEHPTAHVRRTRHFVQPEGEAVALTVVVADGPEPDRTVSDLLHEHGAPHLLVRCSGDEVAVGPLVVPGQSSCVRCADLARRDADPRWPWLLDQLTRLQLVPSPALLAWAAVTAAVQALAFVGGRLPETVDHTLELRADEHALRLRAWPLHPECPCRWAGTEVVAVPDRGRGVGATGQNGARA
jgi:hypothetical protein